MKQFSRMAALLAGASVLAMAGCDNMKQIKHLPYPETARGEVVDNYFGTEVPDPYRWLEDDNSEATAAWVQCHPRAADPTVELPQGGGSVETRRLVLLLL